jgi:protein O-GlcNAc transferase
MKMASQSRRSKAFVHAESLLKRILKFEPAHVRAHIELGMVYIAMNQPDLAEQSLNCASELDPDNSDAHLYLGNLYREQLKHEDSKEEYRKAIVCDPGKSGLYERFIWSLQYSSNTNPINDFELYKKYVGDPIQKSAPQLFNKYDLGGECIKLGYLGSTLRTHSVTFFLLPIISKHSDKFQIYTYNINKRQDETTELIKSYSHSYKHLYEKETEEIAKKINDDGINILIGLDADIHLLRVLSHKPAPIQISWIGHADTTGLDRVDYRVVDNFTDPIDGIADSIHTEKLIRMQKSFSVYAPPEDAPEVNETPAIKNGYITFGSFNIIRKMNADVIRVWARILHAVPDSILILKFVTVEKPICRDSILSAFATHNVPAERLHFLTGVARTADHLKNYQLVDIALDPFPYCGTTTTCDSLWMGVPVVTLAGEKHISRVGLSQLSNVGLPELVAKNHDEYVAIAARLAQDNDKLDSLRTRLRDLMSQSPLMNSEDFTIELEAELANIWGRFKTNAQFPG